MIMFVGFVSALRIAHTTCSAMRFSIGINFQFSSFKMYENNMYIYFFFHSTLRYSFELHRNTCIRIVRARVMLMPGAIKNNLLKCILFFQFRLLYFSLHSFVHLSVRNPSESHIKAKVIKGVGIGWIYHSNRFYFTQLNYFSLAFFFLFLSFIHSFSGFFSISPQNVLPFCLCTCTLNIVSISPQRLLNT